MPDKFVNIFLLLVSCVVGLSLCEVSLRLFYPQYRDVAEAQLSYDAMRIWARTPHQRNYQHHPDTRVPHFVHHNNLALRQHRNFSKADLAAATNIGVFGDSFVENVGMAAPYSFTEPLDYLLNQRPKRFNVLNFGVNGYGPGQSFLHYERFRHAEDLAHVFYVYCHGDMVDLGKRGLFHLDEAGHLIKNEAVRPSWYAPLISRLHTPYLVLDAGGRLSSVMAETTTDPTDPRRRFEERYRDESQRAVRRAIRRGNPTHDGSKNSLEIFRLLIRHWKHVAEHNGSTFSVVLLPQWPEPVIADLLDAEDVEVIDLYNCFGTADPVHSQQPWVQSPYRFKNDYHWNEAGNRLAAVCLYRVLEEKMGIPRLSEEGLQDAIFQYYGTFEGEPPTKDGGGGQKVVSLDTAAAIRGKYQALNDSISLRERVRKLLTTPEMRLIRSVFNVYLDDKRLIYLKEDCHSTDTEARFFLHVRPIDDSDLPEGRRQYGFDNLDFSRPGFRIDDEACGVVRRLPDYPIRHVRTGQYVPDKGRLWEGEFSMDQVAAVERRALR